MNRTLRLFVLLLICASSLACSSLTTRAEGPPAASSQEMARVYFGLNQGFPAGRAYVTEGKHLLGFVTNKEHFYVDLPAGEHLFIMISEQDEAIRANLEPGKTYYVKLFVTPGVMSTRTYWTPLKNSGEDAKTAQEIVAETSRVELVPDKAKSWEADEAEDLNERVASFQSGTDEVGHTMGSEHAH